MAKKGNKFVDDKTMDGEKIGDWGNSVPVEPESTGALPEDAEVVYWETEEVKAEKVRLLTNDAMNDKYLVEVVATGEVLLLPVELLQFTMGEQEIEKSALSQGEKPYNWDKEIDQILLTRDQLRRALWVDGLVSESDSPHPKSIRGILKVLLSKGKLPVIQE